MQYMRRSEKGCLRMRKTREEMEKEKDQTVVVASAEDDVSKNESNVASNFVRRKSKRCGLVSYNELPEYMKDNEFIVKYYRAEWPLSEAFFSLFRWHNETLNVWTHLIGFILFVVLTVGNAIHVNQMTDFITIFTRHFSTSAGSNISHNSKDFFPGPAAQLIDLKEETPLPFRLEELTSPPAAAATAAATTWPFFVFLTGSMFCLLSSSVCHLFSCHSHHLNLKLLQLDYVGITVMIITSFFPPIYYIFQCSPHWQIVYLAGISIIGVCTIMTLLSPALSTGKYRGFRAMLFVSMGLFGVLPAVHALVVNWNDPHRNITLAYESAMALSYLTGTVFYVSRIPEKWKPGWFDLAGHSHQIFHVFVMFGALAHYGAARIFLEYRSSLGCHKH